MNVKSKPRHGLRLVTDEEAAELRAQAPATSQQDMDSAIGSGIRRYQQLQAEADRALFAEPPEIEKLAELTAEMHQLRKRLVGYGVRVPS